MDDDDLDELYERGWDDGYRAALRVLLEADEDEVREGPEMPNVAHSAPICKRL
jgi:hypothetical protein